jgi:hypothetical protein
MLYGTFPRPHEPPVLSGGWLILHKSDICTDNLYLVNFL